MFLSHSYIPTHLLILISNSTGKPIASKFLFLGSIISFQKKKSLFKLRFCSLAQGFHSLSDFAEHLSTNVDIAFPVIHGKFGEDGGIQVCAY